MFVLCWHCLHWRRRGFMPEHSSQSIIFALFGCWWSNWLVLEFENKVVGVVTAVDRKKWWIMLQCLDNERCQLHNKDPGHCLQFVHLEGGHTTSFCYTEPYYLYFQYRYLINDTEEACSASKETSLVTIRWVLPFGSNRAKSRANRIFRTHNLKILEMGYCWSCRRLGNRCF
jgi:hypothetical protein